jgi:hypothetical protein
MPAIFNRADDSLIQVLPSFSNSLLTEMTGKYVIDYPEQFDLSRDLDSLDTSLSAAQVKSNFKDLVHSKFVQAFPSFDVFDHNYLEDLNHPFENGFFPSTDAGSLLRTGYKVSSGPNKTCVIGRSPRKNTIEGSTLTTDMTSPKNKCLITQEIDIEGSTPDGRGRFEFMVYFKDCLRKHTKDSSDLSSTPATFGTLNQTGKVEYQTKRGLENFLRVYISGDNGSTYSEITNLTSFSFPQRRNTIRLAFVNYTDWDINLLTYTLMY